MAYVHRVLLCAALAGAVIPAQAQPFAADPLAAVESESMRVLSSLEEAQGQKRRIETEMQGLTASKAQAHERLQKHVRALYRVTRAGMLPMAGGVNAMLTHLSRVDRMRRVVERDAQALSALELRTQSVGPELAMATRGIEAAQRTLTQLEARKASIVAEQQAAREASMAFATTFESSTSRATVSEARINEGVIRVHDDAPPASTFGSQMGQLMAPVLGAHATERASAGAVVLRTSSTGLVRAVAEGRVIAADERATFGRVVIVDHGDRYVTVYAGLGELDVNVGEFVSRGARLGRVGEIDGEPGVRFEIRRGTERLDAASWLRR